MTADGLATEALSSLVEAAGQEMDPLAKALDVAQQLADEGREAEACAYLLEWVIPLLERRARS